MRLLKKGYISIISLCLAHGMCAMNEETDLLLDDKNNSDAQSIQEIRDKKQDQFWKDVETEVKYAIKERKGTIASLSREQWQKGAVDTLDLSNEDLSTLHGAARFCGALAAKVEDPLIDYSKIIKLNVSNNVLKKALISQFNGLVHLTSYDISHNELTEADLGEFFNIWPQLRSLNLSHNKITASALSWSNHATWPIEWDKEGISDSMPVIHLYGNCSSLNHITTKERLIDRYKEELQGSLHNTCWCDHVGNCICVSGGAALGFTAGVEVGCIGLQTGYITNGTLGLAIGPPVGALVCCLLGWTTNHCYEKSNIEKYIECVDVPLYLQEADIKK